MPPPGRKPDLERRRQAAELRAQGLTLAEVGRRLGITHQAARHLLHPLVRRSGRPVRCAACGQAIRAHGAKQDGRGTRCLACLARTPGATFGQRLRACYLSPCGRCFVPGRSAVPSANPTRAQVAR
jgi:hypothetical protein